MSDVSIKAVQPVGARMQEFAEANASAEQPAAEDQSDFEEANPEEALRTKALLQTTSAHDDWLHRGPFLYELDFHTYVRHVHRQQRPKKPRNDERQRRTPLFLFYSHYVLAESFVQVLDVQGQCTVVVLGALKCPSPEMNNGEDNAAFKSVLGTLLTCPGRGQCSSQVKDAEN